MTTQANENTNTTIEAYEEVWTVYFYNNRATSFYKYANRNFKVLSSDYIKCVNSYTAIQGLSVEDWENVDLSEHVPNKLWSGSHPSAC